jgi:endonuclease-8
MPEGDTVHKIANFLAPRLVGEALVDAKLADAAAARRCIGRRVQNVVARGKHLFIELDNGSAIRSHLGMHGSWHRYPRGDAWQRPRVQLSVALATSDWDYVCFNAKEVEIVRAPSVRNRIVHARLGPDLIADDVEPAALVHRTREILDDDALLADALLDQRVASGIGNVYKSEVLFIEGLSPGTRLVGVDDRRLGNCFVTAAELLRRNLGGGRRVTRFERDQAGRLWVYGRGDQPCLRCDTPIASRRMGRHHRGTYWCPSCQPDE